MEDSEIIVTDVIINTFLNNPDLYDKANPQYVNVSGKKCKLEQIVQYLQEMNIIITVPDIVKKWQRLVGQYKRCLSEEKNCTTGSAATENSFPYYEDMMFLKPSLEHLKPLSSMVPNKVSNNNGSAKRTLHDISNASSKVPELDQFAKKSLKKMRQEDHEVADVTHEMLNTLKVIQSKFNSKEAEALTTINYTNIIVQALNKVPTGLEDECLMHVLNDLEQFEAMHPSSDN